MAKRTEPCLLVKPGFLSLEHAAQWADVSVKTVKRWLSRGLPCYQEGPRTKVLIAPEDIREFLTKRQVAKPNLDAMVEEVLSEFIC